MSSARTLSAIQVQVIWNRLISVVEEQAQALIRTAFGTSTREAGDLSAGVFLPDGRMIAQAVTGTPGHINSMAESVKHFLDKFPPQGMRDGDVYLTNDPWKGTGHLYDMTMVTPVFHRQRLIGLFAATLHVIDIGGIGPGTDSSQIYHEGLFLPILKFIDCGTVNATVLDIIRANVREPEQVEGDLFALVACNEVGGRRLRQVLDEFGLAELQAAGEHIIAQSAQGMLAAVAKWPHGRWSNAMTLDGFESPIVIQALVEISATGVDIDFGGTSGFVAHGVNVVKAYTDAYASFGVRCLIGPDVPNNAGSLSIVRVRAPEGSILDAPPATAVNARHIIGQMLPDVVFGCLRQARPDAVPAEGASSLWNIQLSGGRPVRGAAAETFHGTPRFAITSFSTGGTGARPQQDGLSTTSYPSGVRNISVEILETISPLVFWRKEYRADSGGAGQYRGGLGQVIEISHADHAPMVLDAAWERLHYPARGALGGEPGAVGRVGLASGAELRGKGQQIVPAGEHLVVETPGGGGYGLPGARAPQAVLRDVHAGLISAQDAKNIYGLALSVIPQAVLYPTQWRNT
ncbi:N-methylhydantoinase B [Betaproteobacteria bacterium]|nr:N-methylhydantoinase B [Betaproteobacteria bacterium]GHU24038.1 N-methylhydantoinase B [Betaproteobacteria bacterium]GHU28924.1 N-methylhydantoinase B [Betaproteobacteria bacterium]